MAFFTTLCCFFLLDTLKALHNCKEQSYFNSIMVCFMYAGPFFSFVLEFKVDLRKVSYLTVNYRVSI